jgi:hypothetical protein
MAVGGMVLAMQIKRGAPDLLRAGKRQRGFNG